MKVCFVNQFKDFDAKPIEKLVDVAAEIPNLVDVGTNIGFHDQLVMSNMEIIEHLVMEN